MLPCFALCSADRRFRARVSEWFAHFLALHETTPDATVLVVSHGAYLSALLGVLLSPPYSLTAKGVDLGKHCLNTCVMRVKVKFSPGESESEKAPGRWSGRIVAWGDAEHLGDQARDIGVADDLRQSMRKMQ